MISETALEEIRTFLENAKNPLFFFDDDPDGLCAFLLLYKTYTKGHWICARVAPHEEGIYAEKVDEYKPDLVVILDKAVLSQETIDTINTPTVWIDHHKPLERKGVNYYNPMVSDGKDNRPTTHWAYRVVKNNEWLAVAGIIGDWFVPESDILEKFPYKEMLTGATTPPEYMFDTEYGTIVKMLAFAMKNSTRHAKECINALIAINDPMEIFNRTSEAGKIVYESFEKRNKEYQVLLDEALAQKDEGTIFVFTYTGANSYTGNLSNELLHRLSCEAIIIAREKEGKMLISLRSKGRPIRPALEHALKDFEGYGGGHALACGANVRVEDFTKFISVLSDFFNKQKA